MAWAMGEYPHRACTVRTPRQVFEQLLSEMVNQRRISGWYLVGFQALPFPTSGLWMVAVISWWALVVTAIY